MLRTRSLCVWASILIRRFLNAISGTSGSNGINLGPELVVNGTFDVGTGWTHGANWLIATSQLIHLSGGPHSTTNDGVVVSGKTFRVVVNVDSVVTTLNIQLGSSATTPNISSTGMHIHHVTADGTAILVSGIGAIEIADLSVREVL